MKRYQIVNFSQEAGQSLNFIHDDPCPGGLGLNRSSEDFRVLNQGEIVPIDQEVKP